MENRNVLITGASGLIGTALKEYLTSKSFVVYELSRRSKHAPFYFDESESYVHLDPSTPLFAVVNLAGPSIADKRWSVSRKRKILESRQRLTLALASAMADSTQRPQCFLSASAVGFYGQTGDASADESSDAGNDFLAEVARCWEGATAAAEEAGINTIHLRFGIVLSPDGGVLGKLLLPFKMGLGGRIGSGKQFMSWISIDDVVRIVRRLLEDNPPCGPINLVAGETVRNADFSAALARRLSRPCILPLPEFMVKLLLGEMGEALLLGSSRVTSRKLEQHGIEIQHPTLDSALTTLIDR